MRTIIIRNEENKNFKEMESHHFENHIIRLVSGVVPGNSGGTK